MSGIRILESIWFRPIWYSLTSLQSAILIVLPGIDDQINLTLEQLAILQLQRSKPGAYSLNNAIIHNVSLFLVSAVEGQDEVVRRQRL